MKLSELKKIIKEEVKLNEAPKIKANQKISKKEWRKIKSFNKHIGQDGTHYVMQLTNKGTALVPVVVEGKLSEGVFGKFDMGAGAKGNGITIWDRNQNQGGDYKTIAHISDDGKLKIYDNDVKKEKELMKRISIMVKAQKDYWKSVGHQMEGKLEEQISSFHTIQRNLIDFGFGNMVVSWRGTKKKVKDFKPGNRIDNITLEKTHNTLLKNKSMRYDGNDYKVTPQGKKYFKGTLQLEGKLTEKKNKVKKGSIVIPFTYDKEGEFIVDKVFKNKYGETSYTGKFKKSRKKKEFILHKKDKIVKESVNEGKLTEGPKIKKGDIKKGMMVWFEDGKGSAKKLKVKHVMLSKDKKEEHYITNKGTFTPRDVVGY